MKLNDFIKDDNVLCIYNICKNLYGIFEDIPDKSYVLIVNDKFDTSQFIDNTLTNDDESFTIYPVADWFSMILNNDMLVWECTNLPKKFICKKEYFKVIPSLDLIKLRTNFDKMVSSIKDSAINHINEGNTLTGQKELWSLIKYIKFANQIIENKKIVNYKEAKLEYQLVVDGQISKLNEILSRYEETIKPSLARFMKYTESKLNLFKLRKIQKRLKKCDI